MLSDRRLLHARNVFVVLVTLLGLLGQLALQSQELPGEMPRTTLERLTGLRIGPSSTPDDMCMTMPGMSIEADQQHTPPDQQHPRHDGGACFLCPLLLLPSIVLATSFIMMRVAVRIDRARYVLPPAHAPPPMCSFRLPPPTGPPVTA